MAKAKKTAETENYKLGWLPDLPDARDFAYAAPLKVMMNLPNLVSLKKLCPAVYSQGALGSCTANALGAAFQITQKIQKKSVWTPSRLFLYYNSRVSIHTENSDSGAFLRDAVKSMNKQGLCKETDWTYDDRNQPGDKFTKKPPASCYKSALSNQILTYQSLQKSLSVLQGCLAEGYPFAFGFSVYESFMSAEVKRTGIMPMPHISKERMIGGHAVLAVGYDNSKQAFLIRNSWGKQWGLDGYFYMPYAYATGQMASDFWTIRSIEGRAEPKIKKVAVAKKKSAPKKKKATAK
ncbi:MAG: C1 family peptidase [Ginsengibacter sp.]